MSGRTSLVAGGGSSKPGHMEAVQGTISQSRDQDVAAAATPLRRYVVIVGEHSDGGSAAYRIEDPA
jgi:hypothetical protein